MNSIQKFKSDFFYCLRRIVFPVIRIFPKNKNLILFTAWYGEKYIDNTKYVFEYFVEKGGYDVWWLTKNKTIFNALSDKKFPVVMKSSFKGLWLQFRAKVLFSTVQLADYNNELIVNSIYIDLGHGNMIKDPGDVLRDWRFRRHEALMLNNIDYYAIVPSKYAKKYYQQVIRVPEQKILISDFARNDVFVDESLSAGINNNVKNIARGRKVIVYMPTHRSDGRRPLQLEKVLPLSNIQELCHDNNWVFIIKKHFYHRNESIDLTPYDNIYDITNDATIDPQVLLKQADVLITDYSSCFIDYLLLRRPILFYQFDYDDYIINERSLFIDFQKENFAPVVKEKDKLCVTLKELIDTDNYEYRANAERITSFFFDNVKDLKGREKVYKIMEEIMGKL